MEQFPNKEVAEKKAMKILFDFKDKLSISSRFLYIALLMVDRDTLYKHEELAEITGLSVGTIKNSIRELVNERLLLVNRSSFGAFYTVLLGDEEELKS